MRSYSPLWRADPPGDLTDPGRDSSMLSRPDVRRRGGGGGGMAFVSDAGTGDRDAYSDWGGVGVETASGVAVS